MTDINSYIESRVQGQITWMEGKAAFNQKKYKQIKVMEIIAAATIHFFAGLQPDYRSISIVTGLLGVFIVVLNALQQLYKYHENWITYRSAIEALKREKILYETQIDPYTGADAFQKFVQNFEALLANENKSWQTNWTQKEEKK
jgi:hypothetical protein